MYRSANYVWFINYEDFQREIQNTLRPDSYFFTGYDADSLALEPITHFVEEFFPFFQKTKAFFEIRTKSINIRPLLKITPLDNCIIAYTLSPKCIAEKIEKKAPPLNKRLEALKLLQEKGWVIGLRFDPLIYHEDFAKNYEKLFTTTFSMLDINKIHSVTMGSFRLPKTFYRNMPSSKLLATLEENANDSVSYSKEKQIKLMEFCKNILAHYLPQEKIYIT